MHPLQGASFLSTPLQGGILKPPALRVVDDLTMPLGNRKIHVAGVTPHPNEAWMMQVARNVTMEGCRVIQFSHSIPMRANA
jgi:hypothetical protein